MQKIIPIMLMLIIASCSQYKEQASLDDVASTEQQDLSQLPSSDLYSDGKSDLIKKADIRFQVKDLKKSIEEIDKAIRKYSAFISESDLKYDNPILEEQISIRVLSMAFEPLLNEVEQQAAYLNYRKVSSDDVSKEFVDLESRLKSKREMQERYAEIVRRKANSTEELLKAEYEIGKLHEEIEAVVSRINFLRDQVRYSTINLEVYQVMEQQTASFSVDKPIGGQFSNAFKNGWSGLTAVLIALVNLWPLFLLGIIGYGIALIWKKKNISTNQ